MRPVATQGRVRPDAVPFSKRPDPIEVVSLRIGATNHHVGCGVPGWGEAPEEAIPARRDVPFKPGSVWRSLTSRRIAPTRGSIRCGKIPRHIRLKIFKTVWFRPSQTG